MDTTSDELTVDVDVRVKSPNRLSNEHHMTRARRRQREVAKTQEALNAASTRPSAPGMGHYRVTFTRLGPSSLDDDNLAFSFKALRDAVAEWLGIDDGDPTHHWLYRQEKVRIPVTYRGGFAKKGKPAKRNGFKVWARITIQFVSSSGGALDGEQRGVT